MLALALAHHGRQHHDPFSLSLLQHLVHHLADGLGGQGLIVVGAARLPHPGEEQTQIVIDFGNGAHGGARVVGSGFLFNGDGGREALDMVHIRLFHHGQELPGVGGEGLHVAALSFRIEGIEGQGRFAGPGQARDHGEFVPWNVQIDVTQIVGPGTPDGDGIQ